MNPIESVEANVHFLQEGNGDSELSFRGDVADLQIQDVFAIGVQSSDHCLLAFALGLLELLLGFLLFLYNPFDDDIVKLNHELVDGGLGADGERVVDFEELVSRIFVFLLQGDLDQTVDDFKVVVDVLEGDEGLGELQPDHIRPTDVAATPLLPHILEDL